MDLFPLDLCLYNKCKDFSVHGTISSVVFQNIIIPLVLKTRSPPPDFCLYKCKELEFGVCSNLFTRIIMEKESVCIPDGTKNVGLFVHYIVGV